MDMYNRQEFYNLDTDRKVLVVGAGGVGFWVVFYLAMAGVKDIYVCDDDVLEITNLNRIPATNDDIGRNKAEFLEEYIKKIRPDCRIYGLPMKFTSSFCDDVGIVVDCTDKFSTQKKIKSYCDENKKFYFKAGYDGWNVTSAISLPSWGDEQDEGYRVTPSFVIPGSFSAMLTVMAIIGGVSMKNRSIDILEMMMRYQRG